MCCMHNRVLFDIKAQENQKYNIQLYEINRHVLNFIMNIMCGCKYVFDISEQIVHIKL